MRVQLALSVPPSSDPSRHFFALETFEEAIDAGVPGLGTNDLHKMSGALDPFRIGQLNKVRLQRNKARERLEKLTQRLDRIKARGQ